MPWNLNGNTITNQNWFLGTQNAEPLIFKTDTNAAGLQAEMMRITPSSGPGGGFVGIGTNTPDPIRPGKLEVKTATPDVNSAAIRAEHTGLGANGVIAQADNGSGAFAVWGISQNGFAGFFQGRVSIIGRTEISGPTEIMGPTTIIRGNTEIIGTLKKPLSQFVIDHPADPQNKILTHSAVESPDVLNLYCGNVTSDESGNATVPLPDYFEALNEDFRYQLTVIGELAQAVVAEEIRDNQFTIRTDRPNVKVSWQVAGVRKDPFANMYRTAVEEEKPPEQRGTYLHPEVYGQPRPDTRGQVNAELNAKLQAL